jgi:hypothetical protein
VTCEGAQVVETCQGVQRGGTGLTRACGSSTSSGFTTRGLDGWRWATARGGAGAGFTTLQRRGGGQRRARGRGGAGGGRLTVARGGAGGGQGDM